MFAARTLVSTPRKRIMGVSHYRRELPVNFAKRGHMTEPNDFNRAIIEEFRANGGKVGGQFAGAPLLLLTTTGAKSGRKQTTPVVYSADGDRLIILASKGGAPTNPSWYHNLRAHPTVGVELGRDSFEATAEVTSGAERDRLFAQHAKQFPGFEDYQKNTTRIIPVVALERTR
jgi:deazaflavin-dependent oxidoreductase (nitroreductase family)